MNRAKKHLLLAAQAALWALLLGACQPLAQPTQQAPLEGPRSAATPNLGMMDAVQESPVKRRFLALMDAYNAGDLRQLAALLQATTLPDALEQMGGLDGAVREIGIARFSAGPLDVHVVSRVGEHALRAEGVGRFTREPFALDLEVETLPPHRITRLRPAMGGATPAAPLAGSGMQPDRLAAYLRTYLKTLANHDLFSGAVLVAREGEVLLRAAHGPMGENGQKNHTGTRFAMASASKMFTAIAILQLVQAGKLGLDDPVSTYLPDYAAAPLDGVTIRHLLSHTSGLGSFDFAQIRPLKQIADMLAVDVEPATTAPGEAWRYSNAGYLLLGGVIEAVAGESYYEYLQRNLFAPAGMVGTGAFATDQPPANLATGFTFHADPSQPSVPMRRSNLSLRPRVGSPAGDFYSTVDDLYRLFQALDSGLLLRPEYRDMALSPQVEILTRDDLSLAYGFGFQIERYGPLLCIGHRGGFPGVSTSVAFYPEAGYTVIVLSNYDRSGSVVADHIRQLIREMHPEVDGPGSARP